MNLVTCLLLLFASLLFADEPPTPFGQAFQINTPWKAQVGDDPRWAQPDFDDSAWQSDNSLPNRDGIAWYRLTVRMPDSSAPYGLWIPNVLKSAEFFANGQKIGTHGSIDKWYLERRDLVDPMRLPGNVRSGDVLHIAVRVKRTESGPGIAGKPVIGTWEAVSAQYQLRLSRAYRDAIVSIVMSLLVSATILLALLYWRGDPERIEAFWLGIILLGYFFGDLEAYRGLGLRQGWTLFSAIAMNASAWGAWRFFNGSLVIPWKDQLPYLFLIAVSTGTVIAGRFEVLPWIYAVCSLCILNFTMLVRNGFDTWQRSRKGELWVVWFFAGYLLATLGSLAFYFSVLQKLITASQVGIGSTWHLMTDPFRVDSRNVGELISGAIMVVILARRLNALVQEKQILAAELEAARQVQDLLLPNKATSTPGFVVESSYLPARQVGGDFYFVEALPGGRLLVVVGDVSGKGLRAAMLVSVIVGILRTAEASSAAAILRALNSGLVGHTGGGFVTACSLIFEADGSATIANAGHCPVYRDGKEVEMQPNLPLGVVADNTFDEVTSPAGRFVLISDGVVEAENANRELFGFDRTRELTNQPSREIAEAARAWGQNDDITVVTVQKNSATMRA